MDKLMQFLPVDISKLERNKDVAGLSKVMITHKNLGVREKAAYALGRIKDPLLQEGAGSALIGILNDSFEDQKLRAAVALSLGNLKRRDVERTLINTLTDEYETVRLAAIQALADFNTVESVSALIRKMDDPSSKIKSMTGTVFGLTSEAQSQALRDAIYNDNEMVRTKAAKELGASRNKKVIEALVILLNSPLGDLRKKVMQIIAHFDSEQTFEPLVLRLRNESGENLLVLYQTIAKIKGDKVVDVLLEGIKSDNQQIKSICVQALCDRRSEKATSYLLPILLNPQENPDLRIMVVKGLSKIKSIPVIEAMIEVMEDANDNLRSKIEDALAEMDHPDIFKYLQQLILSPNSTTRFSGVKIIMRLKKQGSSKLLLQLEDDSNKEVMNLVAMSFGDFKEPGVTDALIRILGDRNRAPVVRSSAARSLGRLAEEKALYPLFEALKDNDEYVRGSAAMGLSGYKKMEVIEALGNAMQDSSELVRGMVIESFGQIKDAKVVEYIKRALNDPSDNVRNTANRILTTLNI